MEMFWLEKMKLSRNQSVFPFRVRGMGVFSGHSLFCLGFIPIAALDAEPRDENKNYE